LIKITRTKSSNTAGPTESNLRKSDFQQENEAVSFNGKYSVNKVALVP
jgi:hypothetical protein